MARKIESARPEEAGRFIDGDERGEYVNRPMKLIVVRHDPHARFGPRWVIGAAMLDTGERVAIALADNATRTAMYSGVRADLEADGADAYEPVVLYQEAAKSGGRSFWTFRTATPEEIAEAEEIAANVVTADDAAEAPTEPVKAGKRG